MCSSVETPFLFILAGLQLVYSLIDLFGVLVKRTFFRWAFFDYFWDVIVLGKRNTGFTAVGVDRQAEYGMSG